eukprot:g54356.t1
MCVCVCVVLSRIDQREGFKVPAIEAAEVIMTPTYQSPEGVGVRTVELLLPDMNSYLIPEIGKGKISKKTNEGCPDKMN